MLFKRRAQITRWERFRLWLWPRVSWRRSLLYYSKRTLRLSGTPYAIAMGSAVGAAVSLTPLLGFHFLLTFAIAWPLRANLIAGAIWTCLANPVTYPFIWAGTYELGHFMLRGRSGAAPEHLGHELLHKSVGQIWPLVEPMLLGSIPLGAAIGCIVYIVVYKAVSTYQETRRGRLAGRREAGSPAETV